MVPTTKWRGAAVKGGKKVFNPYNPDFVYRYVKLERLTVRQLELLSGFYLQKAKGILDREAV